MRVRPFFFLLAMAAAAHISARPAAPPRNACQVLTRGDLAAVQGEEYTEATLSTRGATSQCFYQLPSFVKSVSLDLTRRGGREYWREHFEGGEEKEREGEREEEGEVKKPPLRVRGVGNEAFWVGSGKAGSLYVRKGDALLRVSVGGGGTETEKIERSKELARRAMRRM